MNITGEMYNEGTQQSLPFHSFTEKKETYRDLPARKTSSPGNKASHCINSLIDTFGGTVISDFSDELIPYNVT